MSRRSLLLLMLPVALLGAGAWLLAGRPRQNPRSLPSGAPPPPPPVPASPPGGKARDPVQAGVLPPAALAEARACLEGSYASMDELSALVRDRSGPAAEERLEWRVVQFRDPATHAQFRASLESEATESGKQITKLKLFSVDAEGLPDPLPLPQGTAGSGSGLEALLAGKELESDLEARAFRLADGREWRWERENGHTREIDFPEGGRRLRCSASYGEPSCRCTRARFR